MTEIPALPEGVPPHPLDAVWRIRVRGEDFGSVTGHVIMAWLTEGRIDGSCEVSTDDVWGPLRFDAVLAAYAPPRALPAVRRQGELTVFEDNPASARGDAQVSVVINQTFASSRGPLGEQDNGPRNPLFAGLLSIVCPGAGQVYNGRAGRAVFAFGAMIVLWSLFLGWAVNILAAFEAYLDAKSQTLRYHRAHEGAETRI